MPTSAALPPASAPSPLAELYELPDPRRASSVTYPHGYLVAVCAAAVLAGHTTPKSIWRWSCGTSDRVHRELGMIPSPFCTGRLPRPSYPTLQRSLQHQELPTIALAPASGPVGRHYCLDGKTLRGTRSPTGMNVTVALYDTSGEVLSQESSLTQGTEIELVRNLLRRENVTGSIVTLDALHTQRETCALLVAEGAEYVLTVKGNQASLRKEVVAQLRAETGLRASLVSPRAHGRSESRTVRVVAFTSPAWPGARACWMIVRRVTRHGKHRDTKEIAVGITSLDTPTPAQIEGLVRAHWGIENRLHWVRDVTMREDACRTRKEWSGVNLATLRNLAISLLRRSGWVNIQAGLDWVRGAPRRGVRLLRGQTLRPPRGYQ